MSDENPAASRRKFKPLPKPPEPVVVPLWEKRLIRSKEGVVKKLSSNIALILANAPEWTDTLGWNEFTEQVTILKPCPAGEPGPWTDYHDKLTASWLQTSPWRVEVEEILVGRTVEVVARRQSFHPLRDRLNALVWDGQPRLDTWTSKYLGAEDSLVHQAMGAAWMVGAVARVYEPGCQMDSALILEGPQGRGKSSALRILSLGFFTDELADVGSKDAAMQLHGAWLVEIAELDAISRADAAKVKAFLTRRVDRFRPPYGRRVIERSRQCVFAGSVNHSDYLRDETGGRRFWPIECGAIDCDALRRDAEQLWAEAATRYRSGGLSYIQDVVLAAQISEHVATRYQGDPWDARIGEYLQTRVSVSVAECLEHVGVDRARWTQADASRVSKILKSRKMIRKQVRTGDRREWHYCKVTGDGQVTYANASKYEPLPSVTSVTTTINTCESKESEPRINHVEGPCDTRDSGETGDNQSVEETLSDWLEESGMMTGTEPNEGGA